MSATQRLIEAAANVVKCAFDNDYYAGIDDLEDALAAAKEEQEGRKVLTDQEAYDIAKEYAPEEYRIAYATGMRHVRDNGYLAPAPFDVEGATIDIMAAWQEWVEWTGDDLPKINSIHELNERIRKTLEAYAENRSGNLRSNPLTPNSVVDQKGDDVNS